MGGLKALTGGLQALTGGLQALTGGLQALTRWLTRSARMDLRIVKGLVTSACPIPSGSLVLAVTAVTIL